MKVVINKTLQRISHNILSKACHIHTTHIAGIIVLLHSYHHLFQTVISPLIPCTHITIYTRQEYHHLYQTLIHVTTY